MAHPVTPGHSLTLKPCDDPRRLRFLLGEAIVRSTIHEPARDIPVVHETDVLKWAPVQADSRLPSASTRRRYRDAGRAVRLLWRQHLEAIGGDRIAHAGTRNMACCAVAGQGAGIAAALAVRAGCPVRAVDLAPVQRELARQGVRLH